MMARSRTKQKSAAKPARRRKPAARGPITHADEAVLAVFAHEANFGHTDAIVDPSEIPLWRTPVELPRDRHLAAVAWGQAAIGRM